MGGAASSPQPSPDVIAKVLSLSPLGRDLGEDVCLDVAPLFRRVKALQGQSIYAKKELRTNLFVVEEGGLAMITGVFALPTQDTARRASLTCRLYRCPLRRGLFVSKPSRAGVRSRYCGFTCALCPGARA